jgi:undecaprenyl-diphosphatase
VDYRIYHAVNDFVARHSWLGRGMSGIEKWGTIVLAVATIALWLLARPGGDQKWKYASVSALAAAALAILVNRLITQVWHRDRPFEHHAAVVYGGRSQDPSFPSDHASAAFAIAAAVFLFDRLVGSLFLAAAILIGVGRVVVGAHYPGDVLAGALVGTACAIVVVRLARPVLRFLVRAVERATDPMLAPLWRRR